MWAHVVPWSADDKPSPCSACLPYESPLLSAWRLRRLTLNVVAVLHPPVIGLRPAIAPLPDDVVGVACLSLSDECEGHRERAGVPTPAPIILTLLLQTFAGVARTPSAIANGPTVSRSRNSR